MARRRLVLPDAVWIGGVRWRSDLAPVETEKTFVHELLHAACAARIPDDFEEVAVESMETGVLDVIRQFAGLDAFPAGADG